MTPKTPPPDETPALTPGSGEPIPPTATPLAWLTPGVSRLGLIFLCLISIDLAAVVLCIWAKLPPQVAYTGISTTVGTVLGAVFTGSGVKQGADASAPPNGPS